MKLLQLKKQKDEREENNAIELNKMFDKEHILEVKGECIAADSDKNQSDKFDFNDVKDAGVETETNARRRRYKAKPGFCGSCQRKYADLNAHNSQIPMPKTALQCALCNKVFLGKKLLDLHVKRHDQPTLPCLKCAKAESSLCQLWSLRFKHFPAQDQMFS